MKKLTENECDELSESFEEQWSCVNSGVASIRGFLHRVGLDCSDEHRLVGDLIQIDLERSWMTWAKDLPKLVMNVEPVDLLSRFQKLPRLREYSTLLADAIFTNDFRGEIATCESLARDQWGDAIGHLHFLHHYSLAIPSNRFHVPRRVRCIADDGKSIGPAEGIPIRGETSMGRQRSFDPFVEETPDGVRISIANRLDTTISRKQLLVQLLNPRFAIVTNRSKINAVTIASANCSSSAIQLHPSGAMVGEFPFDVRLPGRKLKFF